MSDSIKDQFLANPIYYTENAHAALRERLITVERIYAKDAPKFNHLFDWMALAHEDLGLIAYFVRRDCAALKQHWHLFSRLRVHAAHHEPDSESYTSGGSMSHERELLYAFISDSSAAINEAVMLETPRLHRWRDDPKAAEFSFHLAQLVIRGDYEAAETKVVVGARKAGGQLKKSYATGTDFYSLLMKGDKAGLEASIMDYIKAEQKNTMPIVCDFIRPVSTLRAKLCWHKGIPVEIEHPMVPKDWMPIEPLAHYDDIYDFLSPDWVPPNQGFISRLTRRFQKEFPTVDVSMERVRQIDR